MENSKGGKKILLNGYMYYTRKAVKNNRIRWECSNRAAYACKGAMTTDHAVRTDMLLYIPTDQCTKAQVTR